MGATNRPDLLEPALLRPGRFDRKIFVNVCEDIDSKISILKSQTKDYKLEDGVSLEAIASLLPSYVSGADVAYVCRAAYNSALDRTLELLREEAISQTTKFPNGSSAFSHTLSEEDLNLRISSYIETVPKDKLDVKVLQDDLIIAAENAKPSISKEELAEYNSVSRSLENYGSKVRFYLRNIKHLKIVIFYIQVSNISSQ